MRRFVFLDYLEDFFNLSHLDIDGRPIDSATIQILHEKLKQVRPYILSETAHNRVREASKVVTDNKPFTLPIPFKNIWIEGVSKLGSVEDQDDDGMYVPCIIEFRDAETMDASEVPKELACGVLISEIKEDRYLIACIRPPRGEHESKYSSVVSFFDSKNSEQNSVIKAAHEIVFQIFNNFRDNFVLGSEIVNERVRTGKGDGRTLHKVKDIVHIVNRSEKQQLVESGLKIDWSHRWEVMGHWRKIDGIGKNPNGSYQIVGHTWVNAHVKGPETKDLVRKTRFVRPTDSVAAQSTVSST